MKKTNLLLIALSLLFFASCKKEVDTPKVRYDESKNVVKNPVKRDSSQIKIADLPINMEGTKYLIHPIGDVRLYEDRSSRYGSSNTNSVSYSISNYNRFELTGFLQNLKFQHIDSTAIHALTDKVIQIQTVTYLNTVADRTKMQVLIYNLVDQDTNKDGKLDSNDIKSLYISTIGGKKFKKLSSDFQELIDWNIVEVQNKLYFRTIEDINKNGSFDKNDVVHYHFVNLADNNWEVVNYEPI